MPSAGIEVPLQPGPVKMPQVLGHQHGEPFPEHLFAGVAEYLLCGAVDEQYLAIFVDYDDGIRSRLGNYPVALLALFKRLLVPPGLQRTRLGLPPRRTHRSLRLPG